MKLKNYPQAILNLNICAVFTVICMYGLKNILPRGHTMEFFSRGYILVGLIFFILTIIIFILLIFKRKIQINKKFHLPELKDFILLTLPMSPITSFIILNFEYLDVIGFLYVLIIPLIFSIFFTFILPCLFSYLGSYKMLMISGLVISFITLNMAQITNNPTNYIMGSQFITQGLYLFLSFVIIYTLYSFNKKITYIILVSFMFSGIIINITNNSLHENKNTKDSNNKSKVFFENKKNKIINKKNIYILIFESYANLETLEYYGYDNRNQIKFLEENNFTIYHGTYSKGSTSLSSTSRILELEENFTKDERHYMNGNAFVLNAFKENGYKTVGLFKSPYAFGSSPIVWDEYYPKDDITKIGGKTILKAIYEGYFRFDIFDDNYDLSTYTKLRDKYLSLKQKQPMLFYTHGEYPGHSQNSGKCHKNEKKKYFEGMSKANKQMKKNISLLKKNNPDSIIVILGDHGPYLTKNCTALQNFQQSEINRFDIQDRYGTFLAIQWPKEIEVKKFDIKMIQDIFPAILGNITNNEKLFDELRIERDLLHDNKKRIAGVNVKNGKIIGGADNNKPLFQNKTYNLEN